MNRVVGHLQRNVAAYAAITAVLVTAPTSAYAVATIRSGDIVDGEVRAPDLGTNAVRSAKILDGTVFGNDVADGSLTGTDIAESTLGQVPLATQALTGGTGRSGASGQAKCDPESATFLTCASLGLNLAAPGRVLVIGTITATAEFDADNGEGDCVVGTSVTGPIPGSTVTARTGPEFGQLTVMGVTPVLAAGPVLVGLDCNQEPSFGAIVYFDARIAAVALSAG